MSDLLAKLEAATEGNRGLDDEVLLASGWERLCVGNFYGPMYHWRAPSGKSFTNELDFPDPTRSIDAALTLVPEGWSVQAYFHSDISRISIYELGPVVDMARRVISGPFEGDAPTPPLAICIASIRAMEEG